MPRQRKPENTKRLAGTQRRDRTVGPGPDFGQGDPVRAPIGMPDPVRKIFHKLLKVIPGDVLAPAYVFLLVQLAEALWIRGEAMRALTDGEDKGILLTDSVHGGQPKKNPALTVWRMAAAEVTSIGVKFGLSPKERAALADLMAVGEEEDPFESFLRQKNDSSG